MSPEAMDGLLAVMHGDPYMKARRGAARAGRTRTLGALWRRGFIENIGIELWSLTDAGRKALPDRVCGHEYWTNSDGDQQCIHCKELAPVQWKR